MFQQIVLAYNGSEHAKHAFDAAVEPALKFGSALDIVQVITHRHAPEAVAEFARAEQVQDPDQIEVAKCAASNLAPAASKARARGVKAVAVEVLRGDAADVLIGYAKERNADLIVLGRRGLGRIGGLVLGSVSAKIAGEASCAVLTVK
jgi:nucleotide-binding universal stress UspA family protein